MAHERASVKLNIPNTAVPDGLLSNLPRPGTKPPVPIRMAPRPGTKPPVPGLIAPVQGFAIPGVNTPALTKALIKQETGSYPDPFIFTRVDGEFKTHAENLKAIRDDLATAKENREKNDGLVFNVELSSAFGPAQINYTLAKAVLNDDVNIGLDEEFKTYLREFIQEGENRINAYRWETGAVPDRYKSSSKKGMGKGAITQEKHDKHYGRLTQLAIEEKMRLLTAKGKPLTVENIARVWYAGKPKATEKFIKNVLGFYKENVRPSQELAKTGPRSTMYAPPSGLLNYVE